MCHERAEASALRPLQIEERENTLLQLPDPKLIHNNVFDRLPGSFLDKLRQVNCSVVSIKR
jgi:hypothetical protein